VQKGGSARQKRVSMGFVPGGQKPGKRPSATGPRKPKTALVTAVAETPASTGSVRFFALEVVATNAEDVGRLLTELFGGKRG